MKRILHVIPTLDPSWSQKQLLLLARGLARDRYQVQVVSLRGSAEADVDLTHGVEICQLAAHDRFDLPAWQRWLKLVRNFKPDIIHAWTPEAYRWAWIANRSYDRARLVVSLPDDCRAEAWRWRVADPWLLVNASRVIFNCEGVRAIVAAGKSWAARSMVIPTGVEAPPACGTRAELLESLGLADDALLIGAAGQLRVDRHLKDLIWAADMIKFIRSDVHLLIAGDGPHRARLETFTSQVRIEDKVHLLGRRSEWSRWVGCLDVFASGRESAGQPLAMMEAMACGVPVVATRVPGSEELIDHECDGLLVNVGDRLAIARALQKLLENPALRSQLGATGRQKMGEQFSVTAMVERVSQVYDDVACG
jgi:glycosyltransferase involved in cell wall biosynthesis